MMQRAPAENSEELRRYSRVLLGDRIDADDLVQDCLAPALSRAHVWRPGTDLRAWLFTILHNIHINNLRSRRAHVAANEDLSYGRTARAMAALPDQDARLELRDLERALDRIPDEQRQVLLLVGMEGMRYDAAARVVGVPLRTVLPRVARGRGAVRRSMMCAGPSLASAGDGRARHLRRVK